MLIKIYLQWAQTIAGRSTPILEDPQTPIPQLENEQWLNTLCEYLALSDLNLWIKHIQSPTPKRQNDKVLMNETSNQTKLNVQRINRCRIYLRAETLADIVNAQGTHLQFAALHCQPQGRLNTTQAWPRQERPGPASRKYGGHF